MGLTYVTGDVLKVEPTRIIAHGVNCRGGFGSGVAGQIARTFPEVKRGYMRWFKEGKWKPGEMQVVMTDDGHLVANLATQDTYGREGRHVLYDAVEASFRRLLSFAQTRDCAVAMPKIGAGLGGGEWAKVEQILVNLLDEFDIDVEVYTLD